MEQLLTRVTGRRDALASPDLAHLIDGAQSYVTSWGPLDSERYQVGFNASRITSELTRLNWPVWSAERPLTLLWIAVDFGNGQRALMGEMLADEGLAPEIVDFMQSLRMELDTAASERGLPIVYPLLDLPDQQALGFAEVWGGFDGLIERASQRYNPDAELVGRIAVTDFGLEVRWTLLQNGRSQALLATTVREGVDWLADQYAAEFSIVGGARMTRIAVLDVDSLAAYGRVMSHLESLSVLRSVDVEGFDGTTLNLRVAARGDDRVIERVLTLGGLLVPASAGDASSASTSTLSFRLADSGTQQ